MKKLNKDIALLFLYSMSNTIFFIWPVIYPYLGSYIIHSNPSITLKKLFSTTLGLVLGPTVGNLFLPKFYFLFGIKKTIQIGGFLNLLNCYFYYKVNSIFLVFFNVLLSGAIYQLTILSITYYLSKKHDNGYIYCNYAFIGQNIANIIWPFFALKLINPNNIGMTASHIINNEIDIFFPWEISKNFPLLMNILGFTSFLFTIIPSFFLQDPEIMKPHFFLWINTFFSNNKKNKEELSIAYDKSKIEDKDIFNNSIIGSKSILTDKSDLNKSNSIFTKNSSISEYLSQKSEKELSEEEAKKKANKIIKNPLFLILVLIISIRFAPLYYLVDNYKVLAYPILKNDQLISISLSFSSMLAILGQVFIKKLWESLGFYKCFGFIGFLSLLFHFIFITFATSSSFFMIVNFFFCRIIANLLYGAIYYIKFGLFDPKVAVHISKIFDFSLFLSVVICVGFNSALYDGTNSGFVFFIHFLLNIGSMVVFVIFFKDFEKKIM